MANEVKIKKKKQAKYSDYISGKENSFVKAIRTVLFHRIYFMFVPHYHKKTKTVSLPILAILIMLLIFVTVAFLSFSVLSRNAVVASRMARLEGSHEEQVEEILSLKNTIYSISTNQVYRDDLIKIFEEGRIKNSIKKDFDYSKNELDDIEKVRLKTKELQISKQYIDELSRNIINKKKAMESIPSILPIDNGNYSILSPYQNNNTEARAIVFNTLAGTRVRAVASGEIASITYSTENGFSVSINHVLGISTTYTGLANLEVQVGKSIGKGEVIGSTIKNVLSYRLKVASEYLDPLLFSTYSYAR